MSLLLLTPGVQRLYGRPGGLSFGYSPRLVEEGIDPSVGNGGHAYDNALAETIFSRCKTAVIERRGPWQSFAAVEVTTLEWVQWYNDRRLMGPLGCLSPAQS